MKNKDILRMINSEMNSITTPDVLDRVRQKSSINTNATTKTVSRPKFRQLLMISTLAIILIAIILPMQILIFSFDTVAAATISIDINPSIELTVNAEGKVINASSNNADGKEVLKGINLKRKSLDKAITAILETTDKKGYDISTVNYNIRSENAELKEKFKGKVVNNTQGYYNKKNKQGNINWTENPNPNNPNNPNGPNGPNTPNNPFN